LARGRRAVVVAGATLLGLVLASCSKKDDGASTQPCRGAACGGGGNATGGSPSSGGSGGRAQGGSGGVLPSGTGGSSGAGGSTSGVGGSHTDAGAGGGTAAGSGAASDDGGRSGRQASGGHAGVAAGGSAGRDGRSGSGGQSATGGAGPECTDAVGDFCGTIPRFVGAQVVDGGGDEFCAIPAMSFTVGQMPWVNPSFNANVASVVTLRVAWSDAALHAHVHVADATVSPSVDPTGLWNGDNVQFFMAGTGTLTGAFTGMDDGGARHCIVAPPSTLLPNGSATDFYETPGGLVTPALDTSLYATRLVEDGYEVEVRLPWAAHAAARTPGARFGFNFMVGATDGATLELEAALSNQSPPGPTSCAGATAPGCDDRTWCVPALGS
jgi:hypothetical protein